MKPRRQPKAMRLEGLPINNEMNKEAMKSNPD
jgi:hypothetical protein